MSPDPTVGQRLGERRLAAVVFTDVAGYSARMQQDETGTLALVRTDFARMRARCTEHGGEVLKSTGDGLLLCFPSVVGAVSCALQVQADFAGRGPDALQHRIGVHLGDVYLGGGDVVGEGVNLAARLQTKAPPGGVCVSESVFRAVQGKLPMHAEPLGPQAFKNIAEPVPVYVLRATGPMPATTPRGRRRRPAAALLMVALLGLAATVAAVLWHRERPAPPPHPPGPTPDEPAVDERSLAVLPFANMSVDQDNAFFADGVHEDLLTHLAQIPALKVVSRTSVMQYRNTLKPLRQIAAELHVAYVLEGSVRRSGTTVRVTGQLIRAATDEHVWAQAYDRELKDVFTIQAALATEIAAALQATLSAEQKSLLSRVPTRVPAAYDLLLRARAILNGYLVWDADFAEKLRRAESLLRSAVELDPDFAVAWGYLANVQAQIYFFGLDQTEERREAARRALERAEQLGPDEPAVILNGGAYYQYARRDYKRAEEHYRRLLALLPNDSEAHTLLGYILQHRGDWTGMLVEFRRAYELDPGSRQRQVNLLAKLVFAARRYDEAAAFARRVSKQENDPLGEVTIDCAYIPFYASGSTRELEELAAKVPADQRSRPEYRSIIYDIAGHRGDWAEQARLNATLRAGEVTAVESATVLMALGRVEEARRLLQGEPAGRRDKIRQRPEDYDNYDRLVRAEVLLGHPEAALAALQQYESLIASTGSVRDELGARNLRAFVLAWSGDKEGAVRELQTILRSPDGMVQDIRVSPDFAPLHGHPTFEALMHDPRSNAQLF